MFDSNKKIVYQDTLDEYHKRISALIGTGGSQISTIPTASEDYENVIYQYIGDTDSTYTNGYFYKCIEDPENTGEYIWINISTQAAQSGGTGGGHTILDPEDTEMTQRANLKFGGDFEVSDDSENDVTEVAPHELTNEDMAEIMSTLPTPVNDRLPVLFDEQGTERIVGWYVNSSGLRKPVYEKIIDFGALPNNSSKIVNANISNLDRIISCNGIAYLNTNELAMVLPNTAQSQANEVALDYMYGQGIRVMTASNQTSWNICYITIQYTKTTDTFQ